MSKVKSSDYRKAIRVIQDVRSGVLTPEMLEDIILRIAETHPDVLVKATKDSSIVASLSDAASAVVFTVLAFLRQGEKIQAIKAYRSVTGVGLREAKDVIDKLQSQVTF